MAWLDTNATCAADAVVPMLMCLAIFLPIMYISNRYARYLYRR